MPPTSRKRWIPGASSKISGTKHDGVAKRLTEGISRPPRADQAASGAGAVSASSRVSQAMACARSSPHISAEGCSPPQKAGRSGRPNILQRMSGPSCTHGTLAGLPAGMPGIGLVMDGAMQQAPQASRHFMVFPDRTTGLHCSPLPLRPWPRLRPDLRNRCVRLAQAA